MSRLIGTVILAILVLAMFALVLTALLESPKPVDTAQTMGELFQADSRARQAKDAVGKAGVGELATALNAYFSNDNRGTYPSQSQGFDQLVVDQDLKYVPVSPAGNPYKYQVDPAVCLGTKANPCKEAAVSAVLLEPATIGNVWCWQSKTGMAQEVKASECTP